MAEEKKSLWSKAKELFATYGNPSGGMVHQDIPADRPAVKNDSAPAKKESSYKSEVGKLFAMYGNPSGGMVHADLPAEKKADKPAYKFVHVKRRGGKGGKNDKDKNRNKPQQNAGAGAFHAPGRYTQEQRDGEFNFDTIHGLKLVEVDYTVPPSAERKAKREEFGGTRDETGRPNGDGIRTAFVKMLAKDHVKELTELGLCDADIAMMKEGRVPNGYNVHHKLPLHGGGKNEFKNFILTPLYPHDQWHHDVLDPQIDGIREGESRKVMLPWTDAMVYDPKKYGFTKENQPVKPDYPSKVNPANYPKLYEAKDINVEKRAKDVAAMLAAKNRNQGR